jgi:endonuclease YncB( thermonuclease family)
VSIILLIAAIVALPSYVITSESPINIRVVDGDTIVINERRHRLYGIDAPEIKQKCILLDKHKKEIACGQSAKEHLEDIINKHLP